MRVLAICYEFIPVTLCFFEPSVHSILISNLNWFFITIFFKKMSLLFLEKFMLEIYGRCHHQSPESPLFFTRECEIRNEKTMLLIFFVWTKKARLGIFFSKRY